LKFFIIVTGKKQKNIVKRLVLEGGGFSIMDEIEAAITINASSFEGRQFSLSLTVDPHPPPPPVDLKTSVNAMVRIIMSFLNIVFPL